MLACLANDEKYVKGSFHLADAMKSVNVSAAFAYHVESQVATPTQLLHVQLLLANSDVPHTA